VGRWQIGGVLLNGAPYGIDVGLLASTLAGPSLALGVQNASWRFVEPYGFSAFTETTNSKGSHAGAF
jgi:hypothetical protein